MIPGVAAPAAAALLAAISCAALAAGPEPATAVEQLAGDVAAELVERGAEPPVAVQVKGPSLELSRAFQALLAAALTRAGKAGVALDPSADAPEAARAAGARSVARLWVGLERGLLSARGDLFGTWVNFWSGATPSRPGQPAAAIARSVAADAHALALGTAPVLPGAERGRPLAFAAAPFATLPAPIAALAAGDLDGDRRDEVIALTDAELVVFSGTGKVLARRDLRALPPSATPTRDPAGTVAVLPGPPPRLAWYSGKRAQGELLQLGADGLTPIGPLARPLWAAGAARLEGALRQGENTYAPELSSGHERISLPAPFVTLSALAGARGTELLAIAEDGSGTWTSSPPRGAPSAIPGLGAGTALVDLDGDGAPEIATTSAEYAPHPDELRILGAGQAVLWKGEIAGGRAVEVVPAQLDGDGQPELLVGVWTAGGGGELQVFRRVAP